MIPGWFHGRKEMNYTLVGELNFSSCIWCLCSLRSFRLVFSKPLQDQHALEGWFQQRETKKNLHQIITVWFREAC